MASNHRSIVSFLACLFLLAGVSFAERGDDTNRQSKNGKVEGVIDGVEISIEYGRPSVRDRKIWGGLVPWETVWRTGADEATTISFDRDVLIEGEMLPSGRYALFTVPGMDSWQIIFNNTPDQWGAFSYDENEDALRVAVTPNETEHVETLTFTIEDGKVVMRWGEVAVAFQVRVGE